MNERFGRTDLPHIVRRQLQDLRQSTEESLEEYAERAQELATEGYKYTRGMCPVNGYRWFSKRTD